MCAPGQPGSVGEALAMAQAAADYLAQVDAAALDTQAQAQCLQALERLTAKQAAVQARVLAAFASGRGNESDGQYSAKAWLRHFTRVTRGAAGAAVAAARRLGAHATVADALASGELSASWARQICDWTVKLPEEHREAADEILVAAAMRGADLDVLAQLAEEIYRRVCPVDAADVTRDRYLRLGVTFGGAGRLEGDLTPDATAAVSAVLDALGGKAGPEDTRSLVQRQHDALAEACRRLIAAGTLPGRAGGDTRAEVVIGLRELRSLPGAAAVEDDWITAASAPALTGPAAAAAACGASLIPVVTGQVDSKALDKIGAQPQAKAALLRWAVEVLSGPRGLASRLRTDLLAGPLASPSLPLDVGKAASDVPAHLRRAVTARDRRCVFPGCAQPPPACHPHHIIPRREGGPAALQNVVLLCAFHHLIVIHTWGWSIELHPDGSVTATSPAGRTLHSHSPPAVA